MVDHHLLWALLLVWVDHLLASLLVHHLDSRVDLLLDFPWALLLASDRPLDTVCHLLDSRFSTVASMTSSRQVIGRKGKAVSPDEEEAVDRRQV